MSFYHAPSIFSRRFFSAINKRPWAFFLLSKLVYVIIIILHNPLPVIPQTKYFTYFDKFLHHEYFYR